MRCICLLNVIYTIPQACKNDLNRNMISVILRGTDQLFVQPVTKWTPDTTGMLMTVALTVWILETTVEDDDDDFDDDEDSADEGLSTAHCSCGLQ